MRSIRHITSAILIVLLAGLGGAAHAMTMDCAAGHCDGQISAQNDRHQAGHASPMMFADDVMPRPANADHDGCNPYLCQALVLVLPSTVTLFTQFSTVVAWPTPRARTLVRIDAPDRPPNL